MVIKQNEKEKEGKKEELKLLRELFDKELELEKLKQKKTPIWKIFTYIFVGLASIAFLAFACFMMYKQSFTMETLLTVLLSFFSIALSIMFYIQSEKSSSAYYMRSYEIMKEVSVTLGKIEASFSEKLSHINSNLENFKHQKEEVKNQLEQGEKDVSEIKEKIIKEKNEVEKAKLLIELDEKTSEILSLRRKLERMENIRKRDLQRQSEIRERILSQENMIHKLMSNKKIRNLIMNMNNDDNDIELI